MANLRVDKITSTETFEKTGSVQFDGSGDYLSIPNNADFRLNSTAEDFTIECWAYQSNSSGTQYVAGFYNFGDSRRSWILYFSNGNPRFNFSDDGTNTFGLAGNDVSQSQWVHISVVKKDSVIILYQNGKKTNEILYSGTFLSVSADEFRIGCDWADTISRFWNGHISNFRIVKGTALYTSNFKPSMRELEVVPGTVLLACQSKTDASLEKTGKTITVNGNAVANELTPGILTPIVKSGGGSAITGSVEFDGSGDYLTLANNSDFNFGTGDFTVECFIYVNKHLAGGTDVIVSTYQDSSNGWTLGIHGSSPTDKFYFGIAGDSSQLNSSVLYTDSWVHLAAARSGSTAKFFINGVEVTSASNSTNQTSTSDLHIGTNVGGGILSTEGFISNLRVVKGTALYTADFIPPTRELKKVPGTVLLCCQDENSVTTEATGKTITSNGDPAASNFTPQVGDDRQVTFEGVTKINTDAYLYLPTGDTITRESRSGRGLFMGGYTTSPSNSAVGDIHYINIPSMGNSFDFGDLINAARWAGGSCGSSTRGLYGGGATPASTDHIDFVTIATTSNALDFGNLATAQGYVKACSNQTRGIWGGGRSNNSPVVSSDVIQYITIASTGNAIDFGNLTSARTATGNTASPVRALFGGGYTSPSTTAVDVIDYVTIASTGDATDFGDLLVDVKYSDVASSGIRGLWGGGSAPTTDTIQYVTISSTGNALDFGDLTASIEHISCTDNSIRGVFGGGVTPTYLNVLQYVTIATTGDAKDFGDLSRANLGYAGGTSDSHGGLG